MNKPILSRDWDLVREILIWAEYGGVPEKRPAADKLTLCYHVAIMKEAGLLDAIAEMRQIPGTGEWDPMIVHVKKLTWQGQEFLAAVRSDTVWNKVKAKVAEHGLPVVFDLMKSAALTLAAKHGLAIQ